MTIPDQVAASIRSDGAGEAVTFDLAGRRYAIPIASILQIIPMVKLTPLPQAHPALAGMMAFHGQPVPVVELRVYLGLPALPTTVHTPIILCQMEQKHAPREERRVVGLIVDEVQGVITMAKEQVARAETALPPTLSDLPLLQGFLQTSEGVILLLDLDHLFLVAPSHAALERIVDLLPQPTTDAPVGAALSSDHDSDGASAADISNPSARV